MCLQKVSISRPILNISLRMMSEWQRPICCFITSKSGASPQTLVKGVWEWFFQSTGGREIKGPGRRLRIERFSVMRGVMKMADYWALEEREPEVPIVEKRCPLSRKLCRNILSLLVKFSWMLFTSSYWAWEFLVYEYTRSSSKYTRHDTAEGTRDFCGYS